MKKIITLTLFFLLAAGCNQAQKNGTTVLKDNPQVTDLGSFVKDQKGFHGTLTLTGYLDTKTRVCPPGGMCGETVEYSSFVFSDTNDQDIYEFLGDNEGNSFGGKNYVGIGCYQKNMNRIYYINTADSGTIDGEIKGESLNLLLNSSKESPIKLTLTREVYTSGRGAPDCYSHFRNFKVKS